MQKIESLFPVADVGQFERHRGIFESFADKKNIAAIVFHNQYSNRSVATHCSITRRNRSNTCYPARLDQTENQAAQNNRRDNGIKTVVLQRESGHAGDHADDGCRHEHQ